MQNHATNRRGFLATAAATAALPVFGTETRQAKAAASSADSFRYCLNTSTIRGQKLGIVQEVETAAKAGYDGIEPWIGTLEAYVREGGSLPDLKKRIDDHGLTVESAIGFARWIVNDDTERAKGLDQARRDMELLKSIGGLRLAAPPSGATNGDRLDPLVAADRYRALLEAGADIGVVPQLEVWGFSLNLSRLGESTMVAIESGHPDACLLPDVYHIRRGGSAFTGLEMLSADAIHVFHVNDYPEAEDRTKLTDADRVYPGDGVAPLDWILGTLHRNGCHCALSLELFNKDYWQQDALEVARTGLEKTRAAVARALEKA